MDAFRRGLEAYQKISKKSNEPLAPIDEPAVWIQKPQFPEFAEEAPASPQPSKPSKLFKSEKEQSLRKVAKFLILLGQDEAAKVVRYLDADQIEAIGKEIAGIRKIDPAEAEVLLKEFGYITKQIKTTLKGGNAVAQSILTEAFGPERSRNIMRKSVPGSVPHPFSFLNDVDRHVLRTLLANESDGVLSIVVPFLDKAQAGAFLKSLDPTRRIELVKRLARMEKVSKDIVAKVEVTLRENLRSLNPAATEEVDGKSRLADILRHMSLEKEEKILRGLDHQRPDLTEDIRRRLFTAPQLLKVPDGDFEELLRQRSEAQIALLLLSMDEELRQKVARNISSRRMLLVQAEADLLGETPKREIQREMRFFLEEVREAVREGKVALMDESEEYL